MKAVSEFRLTGALLPLQLCAKKSYPLLDLKWSPNSEQVRTLDFFYSKFCLANNLPLRISALCCVQYLKVFRTEIFFKPSLEHILAQSFYMPV